jgi:hypothetical protein
MKHILRLSTFVVIALISVALACSRQNPEYIGPAYIAAPDGFNVSALTPSMTTINFTPPYENVKYNAKFSSSVSWKLTITGQTSGAVHVIEGTSANLSNVIWRGQMDGAQFFKVGEVAEATLSFYGTSLTTSANVTITGVPSYVHCGSQAPGATFDSPSGTLPATGWNGFNKAPNPKIPNGAYSTFITTIVNVKQGVAVSGGTGDNALQSDRNGNLVVAPEGAGYYYIKGLGDQSAYVSGIGFGTYLPTTYDQFHNYLKSYSPNDIWVNVYLYGSGDANAEAQLEFQECKKCLSVTTAGPMAYTDNYWEAYVPLTHIGWKLFSFKYSELTLSTNKSNGGSGDGIQQPGNLWGYDVTLQKVSNPNSPVELFMDYPIITVGGPFKPCN